MGEIKISFCITCKGRLHHLRETLPLNIQTNREFEGVEFVLLNYSSPDPLDEWVKQELVPEINSGTVIYFKATGYEFYFPAHAKNVAHRLARGEIVCNLDADNFTGENFAGYLYRLFQENNDIFVRPLGSHGAGASGRIAIRKKHFEILGGYDERFQMGWGFEDKDFILRAQAMGLKWEIIPGDSPYARVITHDDLERTQYMRRQGLQTGRQEHKRLSKKSRSNGELVANQNCKWGSARLEKNFDSIVEI
jgi:hypothetical protein